MLLSQNEIRARATAFVRDWRDDRGLEREEAQTFWNEFLQIFGVNRRRVASFEVPVRNLFSAARNDAQRGGRNINPAGSRSIARLPKHAITSTD
jgi:hypothetical protein